MHSFNQPIFGEAPARSQNPEHANLEKTHAKDLEPYWKLETFYLIAHLPRFNQL